MTPIAAQLPSRWFDLTPRGAGDVLTLLGLVGLLVLLYVWTRNYLRLRAERFHPELQLGEEDLCTIVSNAWLSQSEHILTSRRIFQFRKQWFFSRRRAHSLSLSDVTQISFHRRMSFLLLIFLWFGLGFLPLALVVFMLLVELRFYTVNFYTHAFHPPRPFVFVRTFWPAQLGALDRFYRLAQSAWAARRVEKGLPAPIQERSLRETDLRWGRAVWIAVGVYALAAFLQRQITPHITFNDYIFAPLYLGIPVGLARRGLHDALWSALFGIGMILAIAFPGTLPSDFPPGDLEQYAFLIAALPVMALAAWALARWVHSLAAFLALLLWPALVTLWDAPLFFDYGLYLTTALAMAVAVLVGAISRAKEVNV